MHTLTCNDAATLILNVRQHAVSACTGMTRAVKKVVGEAEGHHVQALKGALADAQQKMGEAGA